MKTKPWQYYDPVFEYEQIFQDIEWPWAGHKRFVYDFVRNTKPKNIVELGTHKGTSFFSICQAVKDGDYPTKLTAVDTWVGDPHAGFYDKSVFAEVKTIIKSYYKPLGIQLLKMTFDAAVDNFTNKSIDLLHIDGMHTYDAVKHDFDSWVGKVKPTGTILFHDIYEYKDDFGVHKLWHELKSNFRHIEFPHSHGLGILLLKQNKINLTELESIWQKYYNIYYEFDRVHFQNGNLLQQVRLQTEQLQLNDQIALVQNQVNILENDLRKIKSAKFYKLWHGYASIKRRIL